MNRMLVLALAAEFQGFVRDLHNERVEEFVHRTSFLGPNHALVLRPLLAANRRIDKGNPDAGTLGEDFGRFGSVWWTALNNRDGRTASRQAHLDRLIKARNGIAHADEQKLTDLAQEGYPIILRTVRTWHDAMKGLAGTVDRELCDQVIRVFGGHKPW